MGVIFVKMLEETLYADFFSFRPLQIHKVVKYKIRNYRRPSFARWVAVVWKEEKCRLISVNRRHPKSCGEGSKYRKAILLFVSPTPPLWLGYYDFVDLLVTH